MSQEIKFKKTLKVRSNQPDCVLVFDPDEDQFHEFNSSASELFLMLYEGMTTKAIIDKLMNEYGLSFKEAETELENFIQELKEIKIMC
jgi:PqqD family protein of HPr-rel-A system